MINIVERRVIGDSLTWTEKVGVLSQLRKKRLKLSRRVLFVDPESFRIESPINVHMRDASGQLNKIQKAVALKQWQALVEAYRPLVDQVHIFRPRTKLPDIVFCANQTFPFLAADGRRKVLLSEMRSPTRKPEVKHLADFFSSIGYETLKQPSSKTLCFEGMGDLLPVPGGHFICAGYGPRTDFEALEWVSEQTGRTIAAFELSDPRFYHLDTCLSILDEHTALACRDGFSITGWNLLQKVFPVVIEADPEEANAPGFACNCHSPDGKHVVIQRGNPKTCALLKSAGFKVIEVETSEFIKAGGSVFCMKMMFE